MLKAEVLESGFNNTINSHSMFRVGDDVNESFKILIPDVRIILAEGAFNVSQNNLCYNLIKVLQHFLEMLSILLLFYFSLTHHLCIQDCIQINFFF